MGSVHRKEACNLVQPIFERNRCHLVVGISQSSSRRYSTSTTNNFSQTWLSKSSNLGRPPVSTAKFNLFQCCHSIMYSLAGSASFPKNLASSCRPRRTSHVVNTISFSLQRTGLRFKPSYSCSALYLRLKNAPQRIFHQNQLSRIISASHLSKPVQRYFLSYVASVPSEIAPKLLSEVQKRANEVEPLFIPAASLGYLTLTSQERQLFELLKSVVSTHCPGAELRVAGGWVRDKILGLGSDDVDISTDVVSGAAFCRHLEAYLQVHPISTRESSKKPSVSVTKLNPQQSKHLETAIVTLYGLELNFAQLRTDIYGTQSRIPLISNATPKEDSFRRDFTTNALFYNIMTDTIEDFTGNGIQSILKQVIKTPLPPLETLKDDPLRALRAIRFAARFGFSIHPELMKCIADPYVHELLLKKVTPPRVGIEVQKMLAPTVPRAVDPHLESKTNANAINAYREAINNPLQALHLLVSTGLYSPVFNSISWYQNGHIPKWTPEMVQRGLLLCEYLHYIFAEIDEKRPDAKQTSLVRSALLTMTFLFPLLGDDYASINKISAKGKVPWLEGFKHGLQFPLSSIFSTSQALSGAVQLISLMDRMSASPTLYLPPHDGSHALNIGSKSTKFEKAPPKKNVSQEDVSMCFSKALEQEKYREELGMWLRTAPNFWRSMILMTQLFRTPINSKVETVPKEFSADWLLKEFPVELGLIDAIEQSQMGKARAAKLFFNGHELSEMLSLKPGPDVGYAIDVQLRFQMAHLDADKDAVREHLLMTFPRL